MRHALCSEENASGGSDCSGDFDMTPSCVDAAQLKHRGVQGSTNGVTCKAVLTVSGLGCNMLFARLPLRRLNPVCCWLDT